MNARILFVLTGLLTALLLSLCILSLPGNAEEFTVDDDEGADFSTITEAIEAAQDGDTIHVAEGEYRESIEINKSLSVIGESGWGTEIIVQNNEGPGGMINELGGVLITSNGVVFGNFMFSRADGEDNPPGIEVRGAGNVSVMNCTVSGEFLGGVFLQNCENVTLGNNTLEGLLRLTDARNCTIANNTVHSWIDMYSECSGNLIVGNVCESLITVSGNSSENLFSGNTLAGMYLQASHENRIESNTISHSISISDSQDTHMAGNSFTGGGIHFQEKDYLFEMFASTIIEPTNTVNGKPIIYLVQQTNGSVPTETGQVILAYCDSIRISNLAIDGGEGVLLYNSTNCTIQDSIIRDAITGILLKYCVGITLLNVSVIDGPMDGILIMQSSGVKLQRTIIENCSRYGIRIDTETNGQSANGSSANEPASIGPVTNEFVTIESGIVERCGEIGIRVRGNGVVIDSVHFGSNQEAISIEGDGNRIVGVTIESSTHSGMRISGSGNEIENCSISGSSDGVSLDSGTNNSLISTRFENNVNGIRVTQWSGQNVIRNCTFLNNTEYGIVIESVYDPTMKNDLSGNAYSGNGKGNVIIYGGGGDSSDGDGGTSTESMILMIILTIFVGVGLIGYVAHKKRAPPKVP